MSSNFSQNETQTTYNSSSESPLVSVILIILVTLIGLCILLFAIYRYSSVTLSKTSNKPNPIPTNAVLSIPKLQETQSIESLNPNATIKVAFIRDRNLYVYMDGKEALVAKSKGKTTKESCNHYAYPLISPNGQYLAYIEHYGTAPYIEMGQLICRGVVRIVDFQSGKNKPTSYVTNNLNWNSLNQLELETVYFEENIYINKIFYDGVPVSTIRIYDPTTEQEIVTEKLLFDDRHKKIVGFPIYNNQRIVRFRYGKFYLASLSSNSEIVLLENEPVLDFRGWSSGGKYLLFAGKDSNGKVSDTWFVLNADNSLDYKKIQVSHEDSGKEWFTEAGWYFDQGFVPHCSTNLNFVENTPVLQLLDKNIPVEARSCNQPDAYVAVSPNDEYTFLRVLDSFELHTKTAEKTTVQEPITPIIKNKNTPARMYWVNNEYLVIFEKISGSENNNEKKPNVFLFDRKANIIKPLIQNAYLSEPPHFIKPTEN